MQLELTAEQTMLADTVERFTATQVRPGAGAWDESASLPRGVLAELAAMGLLGMLVPADDGGAELGPLELVVVLGALARGSPGLALVVLAHNLTGAAVAAAGEGAARALLPRLATGEALGTTSLPLAGLESLEWQSGGTVTGVSAPMPYLAGCAVALATVPAGPDRDLVVLANVPEAACEPTPVLGFAAAGLARARLSAAPATRLASGGDALAAVGRLGLAAIAVGIGEAALAEGRAYSLERRQFGQAIAEFQATQWKLANAATQLAAARELTLEAATRPPAQRAAASLEACLLATEAAQGAADDALQLHGGYGYTRELAVERLYRDAKACSVLFAGRDGQRLDLARRLLASA